MSPQARSRTAGYADAMAWVKVWIKQERDRLHAIPVHPRHVRKREYIEGKLTAIRGIERRVEAAYDEATAALDAA